jgi:GLPGLI family protein
MRKIYHLVFLLLIHHLVCGQDTVSLNVVYEFKYIRDLSNKQHPYTANMVLSLGKQHSRYCSEKLYKENDKNAVAERKKQQEQSSASSQPTTVVSGGPLLIVNKYGAIINEELVKNVAARQLTIHARMGIKSYFIETALPVINWTLQNDKKTIGKYTCQKATGSYGGRTYEAWFCPDIPFQDGPWKLSGLPGLILEAKDTKNEVVFTFKELNSNTDAEETTKSFLSNPFSIKTTLKNYMRAKVAFETDPETITSAMAPNARLAVRNLDDPDSPYALKVKQYNPLEFD